MVRERQVNQNRLSDRFIRRTGAVAAVAVGLFGMNPVHLPSGERPYEVAVSIGDSIAAGHGNEPYMDGTSGPENQCYRSKTGIAAAQLGEETINIACQGASLNDIMTGRMYNEAESQIDRLKRLEELGREPNVIVFSGGINERSLADLFNDCLGSICEVNPDLVSGVRRTFVSNEFKEKLTNAYRELLEIAPKAIIVIPGYVTPIEDNFPCDTIPQAGPLIRDINGAIDDINRSLEQVVSDLGDERVVYVGPPEISRCGETIMRLIRNEPQNMHLDFTQWTFGHPNKRGQMKIGQKIIDALKEKGYLPDSGLPPTWLQGMVATLPKRAKLEVPDELYLKS